MAKTTVLTDDLDGSQGAKTVRFGLEGVNYLIDLGDENETRLKEFLRPFVAAATRDEGGRSPYSRPNLRIRTGYSRKVREWAAENGVYLRERGRLPNVILAAFDTKDVEALRSAVSRIDTRTST